eukprot:TRINITY_DN7064_c0_g1_i1.p1 TRINITY_DN7064_c0_g1~~TRINITY_DN7064_c0_g1_i1.p1  ORF type:complete len:444 (+),score=123.95 TRINITY_DN7064_c0_g1_i1:119-1450(+)
MSHSPQPIDAISGPISQGLTFNLSLTHPTRLLPPMRFGNVPKRMDETKNRWQQSEKTRQAKMEDIFTKMKGPTRAFSERLPNDIKDYKMLASVSKRKGDFVKEGIALFCIGVLFDNIRNFKKASQFYEQFAEAAEKTNDHESMALAFNCLAISLQSNNELKKAVYFHKKHRQVAGAKGKIIALCNEGLVHRAMEDLAKAETYHRRAVELSIKHADPGAEALASGMLGMDLLQNESKEIHSEGVRLISRHVSLSIQNGNMDPKNSSLAFRQLGSFACDQGQYAEACEWFGKARSAALASGDVRMGDTGKCNIGIAKAHLRMQKWFQSRQTEIQESFSIEEEKSEFNNEKETEIAESVPRLINMDGSFNLPNAGDFVVSARNSPNGRAPNRWVDDDDYEMDTQPMGAYGESEIIVGNERMEYEQEELIEENADEEYDQGVIFTDA